MPSKFETFKNLHHANGLFVLPNAWNARSAAILEKQGFGAIATSSAAIAGSLGYPDGEGMAFGDYLFIIKRILSAVQVPVTVDMEMGYGASDQEVYANIRELVTLGVAGINIEDSVINGAVRALGDARIFAKTIEYLKSRLLAENLELFINIRCDTYILNIKGKQEETARRLGIYGATGADGIFLPCISKEEDIAEAVRQTKLPLNVMCIPGLPGFEALDRLGVKRASMGPFLFNKVYDNIGVLSMAINASHGFSPIL